MIIARIVCFLIVLFFAFDFAVLAIVFAAFSVGLWATDVSTAITLPAAITFAVSAVTLASVGVYVLFARTTPNSDGATNNGSGILERCICCLLCSSAGVCAGIFVAAFAGLQFQDVNVAVVAFHLTMAIAAILGFAFPNLATEYSFGVVRGFRQRAHAPALFEDRQCRGATPGAKQQQAMALPGERRARFELNASPG